MTFNILKYSIINFVSNLELKTIGQVIKLTITTQIMKCFLWDNSNITIELMFVGINMFFARHTLTLARGQRVLYYYNKFKRYYISLYY